MSVLLPHDRAMPHGAIVVREHFMHIVIFREDWSPCFAMG